MVTVKKALLCAFTASRAALAENCTCTTLAQRREWHVLNLPRFNVLGDHLADDVHRRNLTDTEQKAYIDAELCLMNSPAQLDVPGVQSRWDDLQWVHIVQSNWMHDDVSEAALYRRVACSRFRKLIRFLRDNSLVGTAITCIFTRRSCGLNATTQGTNRMLATANFNVNAPSRICREADGRTDTGRNVSTLAPVAKPRPPFGTRSWDLGATVWEKMSAWWTGPSPISRCIWPTTCQSRTTASAGASTKQSSSMEIRFTSTDAWPSRTTLLSGNVCTILLGRTRLLTRG